MNDFNSGVIEEFRSSGGRTKGWGSHLIVMHTIGAQSGAKRLNPVLGLRDGDTWFVAASKGGSPEHPAWYFNLLAHPELDIEVAGEGGVEVVPVRASELQGQERDAAWQRFVEHSPAFAQYAARAGARVIPVLGLTRR